MKSISASRSRRCILGPLTSGSGGSPAPILGSHYVNC